MPDAILDTVAIRLMIGILLLLAILFLILITYSVIRRMIQHKQDKAFQDSEAYVLPLIYQFMDKEITRKEFADSLRSIHDTVIAFKNIVEMVDSFRDKERKRLRSLLGLRRFDEYFIKKLYSRHTVDIAQACSFYEKRIVAEKQIVNRLMDVQQHDYSIVCYAATLALINMSDQSIRDRSLKVFIRKENNATMAVHDIIFKYYAQHKDHNTAEHFLLNIVADPQTPVKSAAALVKMFPEMGFYQYTDSLFELFVSDLPHDKNGILKAALLNVLNQLHEPGIEHEIIDQNLHRSDFQTVRLETARWIHEHYNSELTPELIDLAADQDLQVRILAQSALLQCSDISYIARLMPNELLSEWDSIKRSGGIHVPAF